MSWLRYSCAKPLPLSARLMWGSLTTPTEVGQGCQSVSHVLIERAKMGKGKRCKVRFTLCNDTLNKSHHLKSIKRSSPPPPRKSNLGMLERPQNCFLFKPDLNCKLLPEDPGHRCKEIFKDSRRGERRGERGAFHG